MIKKFIFVAIALIIMCFIGYNYLYQDHRNIAEEEAEFVITAKELVGDFQKEPSKAETDFLNKTLVVTGKITALNTKNMTLDNNIFCQFENPIESFGIGSTIKIKGRCIGYDDLLGQVKLDQCSVVE